MAYKGKRKSKRKNAEEYTVEFRSWRPPLMGCTLVILLALLGLVPILFSIIDWEGMGCVICGCLMLNITLLCILGGVLLEMKYGMHDYHYSRLIVSPKGVRFVGSNEAWTTTIRWYQMKRLEFRIPFGIQTWTLYYASRNKRLDNHPLMTLSGPGVAYGITLMRWLDGKSDMEHFKSTPIGEAFRYYAPWLFEVEQEYEKRKTGDDGSR